MIFKAALKYKIYEWALDSIFSKIIKNFATQTVDTDLPSVVIYKSSSVDELPSLICETLYKNHIYHSIVPLEVVQDIISAFGHMDEIAAEVCMLFYVDFYDQIQDLEFVNKLQKSIYIELRKTL